MRPAPVWRRLAAAGYDALVLAALWMAAALAVTLINQLTPISRSGGILRGVLLIVGAVFFGWFWSHGGQTLGMRAWRLRLLRTDGNPLSLPAALLRYVVALLPLIAMLYAVAHFGAAAMVAGLIGYLPCFFDARRRALQDFCCGSEMLVLARPSPQAAQSPQGDEHQQQGRQAG